MPESDNSATRGCACILKSLCRHPRATVVDATVPPPLRDEEIGREAPRLERVPLYPPPPTNAPRIGAPRAPWNPRPETDEEREARVRADLLDDLRDPARRAALLDLGLRWKARRYFREFCKQAWHTVEKDTVLIWNWHHDLVCDVLQGMFEDWERSKDDASFVQRVQNVVINMPPGSSKSRIISVFFMCWVWTRRPGCKFICLSVNEDATLRDARAAQEVLKSDWYQRSFEPEWKLKADQSAVSNFANTAGGERLSRAQGSEIVGLRCVAGDTRVATEIGDVEIRDLHEMRDRGMPMPRVWSMNHDTGEIELRRILATLLTRDREVVDVRTQANNVLRCTDDHPIYADGEYAEAASIRGRRVSVLHRTDVSVQDGHAAALRGMSLGVPEVHPLLAAVPAPGRGARQEGARGRSGAVLRQELRSCGAAAARAEGLRGLWRDVPHAGSNLEGDLLDRVQDGAAAGATSGTRGEVVRVRGEVSSRHLARAVLHEDVRESRALGADAGSQQLELLGKIEEDLRRLIMGEPGAADSRAGRARVHGLRPARGVEREVAARAPHRRGHAEQRASEPHHTLRRLPHEAPQVETATVLSADPTLEGGRRAKIDVYDIQVERNHNFFANGVLTHNCDILCIDDANNPKESESKKVRDDVNNLWDSNIYNRVNDVLHSLRIGVQQRTHANDWTGHVIASQGTWDAVKNPRGWLHVVLPAEYEIARRCVTPWGSDPRTIEGSSIHPERWPLTWLAEERARLREQYAGQMQQRPTLASGGKLQDKWWTFCRLAAGVRDDVDALPTGRPRPLTCLQPGACPSILVPQRTHAPGEWDLDRIILSLDPASKKTEAGSRWACLAIGFKGGRRFVLDCQAVRGDYLEVLEGTIIPMIQTWRPSKILIEDKAAGPTIITALTRMMQESTLRDARGKPIMVTLEAVSPDAGGNKEDRVDAVLSYIKNGMVSLLDGAPWLEDFVSECNAFPNGNYDDIPDALSQALAQAMANQRVMPTW